MQSFRFVHDNAENLGRLGICLAYLQKYCQKMTNFRVLSGDLFVFFSMISKLYGHWSSSQILDYL